MSRSVWLGLMVMVAALGAFSLRIEASDHEGQLAEAAERLADETDAELRLLRRSLPGASLLEEVVLTDLEHLHSLARLLYDALSTYRPPSHRETEAAIDRLEGVSQMTERDLNLLGDRAALQEYRTRLSPLVDELLSARATATPPSLVEELFGLTLGQEPQSPARQPTPYGRTSSLAPDTFEVPNFPSSISLFADRPSVGKVLRIEAFGGTIRLSRVRWSYSQGGFSSPHHRQAEPGIDVVSGQPYTLELHRHTEREISNVVVEWHSTSQNDPRRPVVARVTVTP